MRIGELAETAQVPAKTIRFYEIEGVLAPPPRTRSGYRAYDAADAERLAFIKKAKHLGLSLGEIKGILQLHDNQEPTCLHVRSLLDAKLAHVEAVLADLQDFRQELLRLRDAAGTLEDCRPSGGGICGIIEQAVEVPGVGVRTWIETKPGIRAG
jgi:DNA-binding transcriptional MerR regulator